MLKFQLVNKSYVRTPKPDEQIRVEPNVSIVKDLLEEDVDGHVIYFCEEAARIAKPDKKDNHRPVVGIPVVSVKIVLPELGSLPLARSLSSASRR